MGCREVNMALHWCSPAYIPSVSPSSFFFFFLTPFSSTFVSLYTPASRKPRPQSRAIFSIWKTINAAIRSCWLLAQTKQMSRGLILYLPYTLVGTAYSGDLDPRRHSALCRLGFSPAERPRPHSLGLSIILVLPLSPCWSRSQSPSRILDCNFARITNMVSFITKLPGQRRHKPVNNSKYNTPAPAQLAVRTMAKKPALRFLEIPALTGFVQSKVL